MTKVTKVMLPIQLTLVRRDSAKTTGRLLRDGWFSFGVAEVAITAIYLQNWFVQ